MHWHYASVNTLLSFLKVKQMTKQRKTIFGSEKAVSPVIGVMLMVVVTVILAAAVSSNSVGFMQGSKTAPVAVFEVQIKMDVPVGSDNVSFMKITETTGDTIDTADLKITTYYPKSNDNPLTEVLPTGSDVPYWNNPAMDEEDAKFGNYVVKPGVVMIAQSDSTKDDMKTMIADWDDVESGDFITVSIVHTPTGKVIFESDVEVV
jgi:flagellin-like protein